MVLDVKIDQVIAEKIKVKHQSVFFETLCIIVWLLLAKLLTPTEPDPVSNSS